MQDFFFAKINYFNLKFTELLSPIFPMSDIIHALNFRFCVLRFIRIYCRTKVQRTCNACSGAIIFKRIYTMLKNTIWLETFVSE